VCDSIEAVWQQAAGGKGVCEVVVVGVGLMVMVQDDDDQQSM
jgi:hypothetical protein